MMKSTSESRNAPRRTHKRAPLASVLYSSLVFYCLLQAIFQATQRSQAPSSPHFDSASLDSHSNSITNQAHQRTSHLLKWLPRVVLYAQAASASQQNSALYNIGNQNQDREIISLNLTNFNPELIQSRHQFPHIKLIEFYVSYCGFCAKFKQTFLKLAKEIHPWRNVIRPAALDLSSQLNIPIANAKVVDEVPKLRLHPPPPKLIADRLDKQLASLRKSFSLDQSLLQTTNSSISNGFAQTELLKSMLDEYNLSNLMIEPLENTKQYLDNVPLLKAHLLSYIERFVHHRIDVQQQELPRTWPNLHPVTETSLAQLRANHPRGELFLLIEGQPQQEPSISQTSETDQSSTVPVSLGLNIIMELSSSDSWRAVRYVRASENKPLIEEVISKLNATATQLSSGPTTPPTTTTTTTTTTTSTTTTSSITTLSSSSEATAAVASMPQGTAILNNNDRSQPQYPNQQKQQQQHHSHLLNLHNNQNLHAEHLELLNNLLMNRTKSGNNILIVHMSVPQHQHHHHHHHHQHTGGERYSPNSLSSTPLAPNLAQQQQETSSVTDQNSSPFISVLSGVDLASADHPEMLLDPLETMQSNNGGRAKRLVIDHHVLMQRAQQEHEEKNVVNLGAQRKRRSMALSSVRPTMPDDQISRERLVELVSSYIRQTYTETDEDREFVKAINQLEEPYQIPQSFNYIVIACFGCFMLIVVLRCANGYVERQRRHKATLLNEMKNSAK